MTREEHINWIISGDEGELLALAEMKMPFGKHEGTELGFIPLKYLDQTTSTMPDSWLIRKIKRFLDLSMEEVRLHVSFYPVCFDKCWEELWDKIRAERRAVHDRQDKEAKPA